MLGGHVWPGYSDGPCHSSCVALLRCFSECQVVSAVRPIWEAGQGRRASFSQPCRGLLCHLFRRSKMQGQLLQIFDLEAIEFSGYSVGVKRLTCENVLRKAPAVWMQAKTPMKVLLLYLPLIAFANLLIDFVALRAAIAHSIASQKVGHRA